jgi:aspartate aminotransferase
MKLSKLVISLKPSATLKLNEIANKLKSEGKDIVHLGGGEPEFDIPESAQKEVIERLKTKRVRYTPTAGIKKLREEIVNYVNDIYNFKVDIDNIVVSTGAKQAIYNFLLSVLDPGDEVLIIAPYWVSYTEMVSMAYAHPVVVRPSQGLIPSINDIKRCISSNTKLIMINSPNNPTGLIWTNELIKDLIDLAEKNDIYVLFDSIYDQLIIDDFDYKNPFSFVDDIEKSNVVVVNGVSKAFSMTGFRIGFSIASKELSKAMTKIQAQVTSCPSELSQYGAVGALREGKKFSKKLVDDLRRKRDILVDELSKIKKAKFIKPQATFYSFVDFSEYEKDSSKLSSTLIEKTGVVTVPGIEFGMEGYLRISFCSDVDSIKKGVSRIREFLDGENL